ncbi:MAG: ABC transporter substrate-binding protein [Anaerolineae bacterium]|nr:MAG: ABC transporter substrate-binding protein [Anaerolineae bacterium]
MKTATPFKRLVLTALTLLVAASLLLAACAPAGGDTTTPEDTTGGEAPATDPTEDTAAVPAGPAGKLRVAFQPIVATDPGLISSDSEVFVANHVYDYLVDIDAQSNPTPRLATGWTVSDDGLTYVFTLAEGVTFHDGSAFSAADVVYTFNRLRDVNGGLPTASLYANIAAIEATGDLEVTFTLSAPNPFFLYDLSDNHALVIKDGTADPTDFNGTGPFKVVSYTPEDRIVLEANPAYFQAGKPGLAGLEVIFFADDQAMVDALRGGQVDLVMRMSTSLFESLIGEAGITTLDIPTNGFDLVRLRADRAPGNDPRVVEALKLATDREAIWQLVQQGYGAVGNDSPVGPLYGPYHDPSVQPPARDVERARALLAEYAAETGGDPTLNLVLHVPDSGGRPDLAAVLQQQWAEAGIVVELSVEPESVYYADGENGWLGVDLGITGWGSRPYPQFYFTQMLASNGEWNEAHWSDAEVDALIATAGSTLDEAERAAAYQQLQAILAERGPVIIPYYFAQFGAISDAFTGFEMKAFAGRTDVSGVTLATP